MIVSRGPETPNLEKEVPQTSETFPQRGSFAPPVNQTIQETSGNQDFQIKRTDRVMFVGPPRSGKSNLQAWLLEQESSWVVIDSKMHPDEWASWGPKQRAIVTKDPDDIARYPKVVFQPNNNDLIDRSGWRKPGHPWTRALQLIFQRGHTICVFDETVQTMPAGSSHPDALRLYTQGAAYGVPCWAGTQLANRIDTLTSRLAEHCFTFRLGPMDSRILCEARGVRGEELAGLQKYHFAYHGAGDRAWTLCPPVDPVL